MLRYASRNMRRSESASSFCEVPACGTVNAVAKLGTVITVGPVKVLLAGIPKSAWNLNRLSEVVVWRVTKKFGDPAGGGVLPSRSEGRRPATLVDCWKQIWVAGRPASILVRS